MSTESFSLQGTLLKAQPRNCLFQCYKPELCHIAILNGARKAEKYSNFAGHIDTLKRFWYSGEWISNWQIAMPTKLHISSHLIMS